MDNNSPKIHKWLYPISFLYGIGVRIRNLLFDWGILKSKTFDIPVISVGNITVGGTGKTPHIEYLIRILQNDFQVSVLSRGYKRKSKGFVLLTNETDATTAGDEPYQIKQKFPNIHMAVDKDRCHGIELLSKNDIIPASEVVLLDDAFQHRYVEPGLNILLIDYNRLISKDALLPAGRLREPIKGIDRAHIIIMTKCPPDIRPMEFRVLSKEIRLYSYQHLYFTTFKYGSLTPVFKGTRIKKRQLSEIGNDENILLLTGIATPQHLRQELEQYSSNIDSLTFKDHHNFTAGDIMTIRNKFEAIKSEKKIIITTEKDAGRLLNIPDIDDSIKQNIYYLPVEVEFLQNQQDNFNQNIIGYVRKNKRNSVLSKRENAYKS